MDNPQFYIYFWLREKDDLFPKGTPYYIGKGRRERAFIKHSHRVERPPYKDHILLEYYSNENEAFEAEKFFIKLYGRIDLNTGCLLNKTNGGEGASGHIMSDETREKISNTHQNREISEETRARMSVAQKGRIVTQASLEKRYETLEFNKAQRLWGKPPTQKKIPLWVYENKKVREILLRAFPKLDLDPVQRRGAGRWARIIHLYYRLKWSRGQIAKEMGLQYYTVNDLIRSIKRVAAGKRANGTGLRGQNPVGRPKKVR